MTEAEVASPCVSLCAMDKSTGLCIGCSRTMDEISGWWQLDNAAKQKIVDVAAERQAATLEQS